MLFGAHVSIKGGLPEAPKRAAAFGCECFQIFSRSPRGGRAPALTRKTIKAFRRACDDAAQASWYIHTPYYINLASDVPRIRSASIQVVREELERGRAIGAAAVMTHLGSAGKGSRPDAMKRAVAGIRRVLEGYRGKTGLLVEIAAGSGGILGSSFEEIARIVDASGGRCGVCFDTQHAFASGYDLRTVAALENTLDLFEEIIGLENLRLIHVNDSMVPLGSGKDRHEHIGRGRIGEDGFRAIVGEARLQGVDGVLETRIERVDMDLRRLKKMRAERSWISRNLSC
jgi:deoxyribonuclease-4